MSRDAVVRGEGTAVVSADGLYRYRLTRRWQDGEQAAFVMLNPSTADAIVDDPTVRRCIGFARTWGYGGLEVVNLFALRSTGPAILYRHDDPVGPENDRAILEAVAGAALVVCAWGMHGRAKGRAAAVRRLLQESGVVLHQLGQTSGGEPAHPLYLRADLMPAPLAKSLREPDRVGFSPAPTRVRALEPRATVPQANAGSSFEYLKTSG